MIDLKKGINKEYIKNKHEKNRKRKEENFIFKRKEAKIKII